MIEMSEKVPFGFKCLNCGKIHYPKHGRCVKCKQTEFERINLTNEGTLLTYTSLKAPPTGIDKFTLHLGIIDLGDVRYTGQLLLEDPSVLKIGLKLKSTWMKVREIDGEDIYGFVWTPL